MHPANSVRTEHIGDFVGVHENACCSFSQRSFREFRNRQHGTLYMHMCIQQAWGNKTACCINDLSILSNRMSGIANISDSAFGNRNVCVRQQLTCIYVDKCPVFYD
ncbi:hypothetical protein D3C76_1391530 [compost metagenome]